MVIEISFSALTGLAHYYQLFQILFETSEFESQCGTFICMLCADNTQHTILEFRWSN